MRKSAYGRLAGEANRRRVAILHRLRLVAVAEMDRDRARAGLAEANRLIAEGQALGRDTSQDEDRIASLRNRLAVLEGDLAEARIIAGLDTAHAA